LAAVCFAIASYIASKIIEGDKGGKTGESREIVRVERREGGKEENESERQGRWEKEVNGKMD
jgi:hypothetical protein